MTHSTSLPQSRRPSASVRRSLLIAAVAGCFACLQGYAQQNWTTVSLPDASATTLTSITFLSDEFGYAHAFEGDGLTSYTPFLFRTSDGGANWTKIPIHEAGISIVTFLDESHAVGYGRNRECSCTQIARSTDGGETWQGKDFTEMSYATSLQRLGPEEAYLTGSNQDYSKTISLRTTDAGVTWEEYGSAPVGLNVRQIMSENLWYGTAGTSLYTSTDGGMTWTGGKVGPLSGIGRIRDVTFLSGSVGFLATGNNGPYPEIFRSTDGGESWESVYVSSSYPYEMDNIAFVNDDVGFAVSGDEVVVMTSNGGESWEVNGEIGNVLDVTRQGETVWAVGSEGLLLRRSASEFMAATPVIAADVGKIEFGQILLGDTEEITIEIANNGGAELEITDISLAGAGSDLEITKQPNIPLSFPPGLSIRVTIEYHPAEKGALAAELQITSNDPSVPVLSIPVTGIGTDEITSVSDRRDRLSARITPRPNPIGEMGTLQVTLLQPVSGEISLYDMRGALVRTIYIGRLETGEHSFRLDRIELPPGEYRCVITDNGEIRGVCTVRR